ncbi:hypothetical protein CISIN_1g035826mg, partial [Citrus sinensis]
PSSKLLAGEDEPLLARRNPLLVLNLRLHVVDRVGALHLLSDGFPGRRLDEDLHSSPQARHQMEHRLLLDVVISQDALVGENQPPPEMTPPAACR